MKGAKYFSYWRDCDWQIDTIQSRQTHLLQEKTLWFRRGKFKLNMICIEDATELVLNLSNSATKGFPHLYQIVYSIDSLLFDVGVAKFVFWLQGLPQTTSAQW